MGNIQGSSTTTVEVIETIPFPELDKIEMVEITGGTFFHQDRDGNGFNHTVSDYSIGKYEVTYELWHTVYTWAISNEYYFENPGIEESNGPEGVEPTVGYYKPVTKVNWRDAKIWKFCW